MEELSEKDTKKGPSDLAHSTLERVRELDDGIIELSNALPDIKGLKEDVRQGIIGDRSITEYAEHQFRVSEAKRVADQIRILQEQKEETIYDGFMAIFETCITNPSLLPEGYSLRKNDNPDDYFVRALGPSYTLRTPPKFKGVGSFNAELTYSIELRFRRKPKDTKLSFDDTTYSDNGRILYPINPPSRTDVLLGFIENFLPNSSLKNS